MSDSDYIKMCQQDFAANSRQSNDFNGISSVGILGIILIGFAIFGIAVMIGVI